MSSPAFEINGRSSTPEQFYALACDPGRSVVVEACAGAGKTWMLVSRMLRALLQGAKQQSDGSWQLAVAPHEILAITFTKKAAGEMRQRLNSWLIEFITLPEAKLVQELGLRGLDAAATTAAVPALRQLYPLLLSLDRGVQIRTFHSWFASLLHAAPMSVLQALNLPLRHELLEDDSGAVALVWRPFYAALRDAPELLADYQSLVQSHGRFQTKKALSAALSKRVEFDLADAAGVVEASVQAFGQMFPELAQLEQPQDALVQAGHLQDALWSAARVLGAGHTKTLKEQGAKLEQALSNRCVPDIFDVMITQTGTARKFSDKLIGYSALLDTQTWVLRIRQAQAQHEAWQYQQRMTRLTRLLLREFALLKRDRGWVDMNDIERAALLVLSHSEIGAWVAQRLDARIRHLLIDEFQDTNPLQWQALQSWLSGYAGSGGGGSGPSVFIVGDPKQSIYRFRRAEPQVFMAAKDFVQQGLGGDVLKCDHTRRCAQAVIGLVNQTMLEAGQHDHYPGFKAHSTASKERGEIWRLPQVARAEPDGDAVEHSPDASPWRDSLTTPRFVAEETRTNLECRQAAAWVAQRLAAGVAGKDIMVLARKRSRLSVMQLELSRLGIQAQQPEKSDLYDAPAVRDLVALLDALVSPQHDLALAQALKSPLFGWSDADLVDLSLRQRAATPTQAPGPTWLSILQHSPDLPEHMTQAGQLLGHWQQRLALLPPHDALAEIFVQGKVLERYTAACPPSLRASVLAHLNGLLAASLQLDASRYATPYALVRAIKAGGIRAPNSADVNAVRLLTIHGAKGLEAPWVLMLDTDAAPAKADNMSVLVQWPGQSPRPERLVFLVAESQPPACAVDLLTQEHAERDREELNALYVALTRAEYGVVISAVEPRHAAPRSWWQRLYDAAQPAQPGLPPPTAVPSPADTAVLWTLPSVSSPRASRASDGVATDEPGSPESVQGQALHRLLEYADMGAWHSDAGLLARVAQEFALDAAQVRQVSEMAQAIRQGAGAWSWDPQCVDWHGNEVELNWRGTTLRLDRLVRRSDTGHWWVLDYKSHPNPMAVPELRQQLLNYRAALQALYPGDVVRAAFLSGSGLIQELA